MLLARDMPAGNDALRQAVYAGAIFKQPPAKTSLALVAALRERLAGIFDGAAETAHERIPQAEFLAAMKTLRSAIEKEDFYRQRVLELMDECGFSARENAFDVLRIRSVLPNGHLNKDLERSYSLHRDTWYANPQSQVNWWVSIYDAPEERAFSFYPDYFSKKIENTSARFDFDAWMNKVGWQSARGNADFDYPRALETPAGEGRVSFSCKAGEILLFSAVQLHQTNPHASTLTRFSFDFRTVNMADHREGRGAPNADNGSRADALRDYILPQGSAA